MLNNMKNYLPSNNYIEKSEVKVTLKYLLPKECSLVSSQHG